MLTGAGISAESGLPTFRGAGGIWRGYRAQDVATPEAFRADPGGHPLATPSGKIELFSATVAGFGYPDCPGYAAWLALRSTRSA